MLSPFRTLASIALVALLLLLTLVVAGWVLRGWQW